jgi:hypothetical protein
MEATAAAPSVVSTFILDGCYCNLITPRRCALTLKWGPQSTGANAPFYKFP